MLINRNFQFKTIAELHEFHLCSNCFFTAYDGNIDKKYFSTNDSVLKLNQFLKFQCHDSEESVYEFLSNLYKTLNRENGKKIQFCHLDYHLLLNLGFLKLYHVFVCRSYLIHFQCLIALIKHY